MALIRHSMLAAGSAVVLTGSRFAFMAILSHRLLLEEFGQVAFVQWLVDLSILLCSFGANSVAGRYFAEYRTRPDLLTQVMRRWRPLAFALPLLAATVAAGAGAWVTPQRPVWESVSIAVWAFANGMWVMQSAALTGFQRFDRILLANCVSAAVLLGGAAILPRALGIGGVFGLCALANFGAALFALRLMPAMASEAQISQEAPAWSGLRHYAINMWLTALLWSLVWSRGEWPFVKAQVGDIGIARYAAVTTLFGGAVQGIMLAVAGLAPQLTLLWGKGQVDEALALSRRAMAVQLLLAGGLATALVLFGPWLLQIAFGSNYRGGSQALAWIAVGLPALSWACHNHLLQLATNARYTRDTTLAGLILLFGLAEVLVPRLGIEGGAIARAGTMCFMAILSALATALRWRTGAVPWRNLTVATLVLATAASVCVGLPAISIATRIGIFVFLSSALVFGIRENGSAATVVWVAQLAAVRTPGTTPSRKSEQCA